MPLKTTHCTFKYIVQVSVLYWSSFILTNFYFYFTTFQSTKSYFLLHYISLNISLKKNTYRVRIVLKLLGGPPRPTYPPPTTLLEPFNNKKIHLTFLFTHFFFFFVYISNHLYESEHLLMNELSFLLFCTFLLMLMYKKKNNPLTLCIQN